MELQVRTKTAIVLGILYCVWVSVLCVVYCVFPEYMTETITVIYHRPGCLRSTVLILSSHLSKMWFWREKTHQYALVTDAGSTATAAQMGHRIRLWAYLSAILNIVLVIGIAIVAALQWDRYQSPLPPWPSTVYSPTQHIVRYETVMFNQGFDRNK